MLNKLLHSWRKWSKFFLHSLWTTICDNADGWFTSSKLPTVLRSWSWEFNWNKSGWLLSKCDSTVYLLQEHPIDVH